MIQALQDLSLQMDVLLFFDLQGLQLEGLVLSLPHLKVVRIAQLVFIAGMPSIFSPCLILVRQPLDPENFAVRFPE